jgi:hypothetical protein
MRLRLMFLAVLALAAIALGIVAVQPQASPTSCFGATHAFDTAPPIVYRSPLHVHCDHPADLHLIRFEDGSARLECAHHVLVRISVPG